MRRPVQITARTSANATLGAALRSDARSIKTPRRASFREFLEKDARVPADSADAERRGTYVPFTFKGREALIGVVEAIDTVLGLQDGKVRKDAEIAVGGGAQIGKTILEHELLTFCTGQQFRNTILYVPDQNLVNDLVQTKFRPNVVDQLPWFADMLRLGVVVNSSGKSLHRIGAFSVTDGNRRANGMFAGLGKVPTSISGDIALEDEVDDVDPKFEKFVRGRLSSSDLRFIFRIGTQRVHGRGMNMEWRNGSQGVVQFECPKCKHRQNPEDEFPAIVCLAQPRGEPARLTYNGDFAVRGRAVGNHEASHTYFLGCVKCGAKLNRSAPLWHHRRPEMIAKAKWSFRLSQVGMAAIDLSKIVNEWSGALLDDLKMAVFRCDVLALPKSTAQKLDPEILQRARLMERFDVGSPVSTHPRFAGLDFGQKCYLVVRERINEHRKKIIWVEEIPLHMVTTRCVYLSKLLQISCLFMDQMPETKEARSLALALNGLTTLEHWPSIPSRGRAHVMLPGGLRFERTEQGVERWTGLKCAVVRFDKKRIGAGIDQTLDIFTGGNGREMFVPMIQCNRFETIDGVVREFLTPAEGEMDASHQLGLRNHPAIMLPQVPRSTDVWHTFDNHHIAGSERVKESGGEMGDYVDEVPNHFLFANGYARLAELIGGAAIARPMALSTVPKFIRKRHGV